ncbi:hypothetical protein DVB69_01390 [Sporosarcina sp. BI001-red]|uniref:DnaA N-terminal domain-containing protein n=1 Tax=Sporosarcina sp. BI001-red TaxID=2282866 RepID=UPI000E257600|nr:DnaA N-terminal domain-containing protein [Sporosarcina sp. BI001-red]REB11020.1 hypothetical protein DVB69_01390 [Sporosarcina sp. BI001-red]
MLKIENEDELFRHFMSMGIKKPETEIMIPGKGNFRISYLVYEHADGGGNLEPDGIAKGEHQFLLWNDVLLKVQGGMSAAKFETWFKNTTAIPFDGQRLGVVCQNSFQLEWIKEHYSQLILNILEELTGKQFELEFLVA